MAGSSLQDRPQTGPNARKNRPASSLAVAFATNLAFVCLAIMVSKGLTASFDQAVLLAFREDGNFGHPLGPLWLPTLMRDFTALGGFGPLTLITTFAACYLMIMGRQVLAIFVAAAVLSGALASHLLKDLFHRGRPDLIPGIDLPSDGSFPSGHTMLSAITYITLAFLLCRAESRKSGQIFIITAGMMAAFLVGTSRIYLGVHWPTDVIGGWCMGLTWALLWHVIVLRFDAQ